MPLYLSIKADCSDLQGLPVLRSHFWPFTGVLQEIQRDITRRVWGVFKELLCRRVIRKAAQASSKVAGMRRLVEQAIDYAMCRACFRSGEIRILNQMGLLSASYRLMRAIEGCDSELVLPLITTRC